MADIIAHNPRLEKKDSPEFFSCWHSEEKPKAIKIPAIISREYLICCSEAVATQSAIFSGGGPKPKKIETSIQGTTRKKAPKACCRFVGLLFFMFLNPRTHNAVTIRATLIIQIGK